MNTHQRRRQFRQYILFENLVEGELDDRGFPTINGISEHRGQMNMTIFLSSGILQIRDKLFLRQIYHRYATTMKIILINREKFKIFVLIFPLRISTQKSIGNSIPPFGPGVRKRNFQTR